MIKYIFAAAALLISTPVSAQTDEDWTYTGTSSDGSDWYISTANWLAGKSTDIVAPMWVKIDHSRNKTTALRTSYALYSVNCPHQTYYFTEWIGEYPDGRRETDDSTTSGAARPGSILAHLIKMLCS